MKIAAIILAAAVTAVPWQAALSNPYDGSYTGIQTLTRAVSAQGCTGTVGLQQQRTLAIADGKFSFMFNRAYNVLVTGVVSADGSLDGFANSSAGGTRLTGNIQGTTFTGEVHSGYCEYSLRLVR